LLAVAVLGIVMLQTFNTQLDRRLQGLPLTPELKQSIDEQRSKLAAAELPKNVDPALGQELKQAIDAAFVAGYRRVMAVSIVLALLSALSAWWLIDGKRAGASAPS
jgi:hypothetical protein